MTPFSLLVKPVGGSCNLACRYCFYRGHAGGVMRRDVLERLLEGYLALPFAGKSVALQGGEPMLSPDYVFDVLDSAPLASRSVQTNGTLLTRERARQFCRGGWLVGISLDGDETCNSARVRPDGGASFADAVRGIRALESEGVEYNILSVVSKANVRRPVETYRFLRDSFRTRFHQYIECTGPCHREAVTAEEWGSFLCGLFDEWIKRDAHEVSIGIFDSIMSHLVRGYPTRCASASHCRHYLVVEHDGSVYPCDFNVRPGLRLGNVMECGWEELLASPVYERFSRAKCEGLPARCATCRYSSLCNGDCPRSRIGGRPVLCDGWLRFFDHALPRLEELLMT